MNRTTTLSTLAKKPPEPLRNTRFRFARTIFTNNGDGWTATPWSIGFMQRPRHRERSSLAAPEALPVLTVVLQNRPQVLITRS
jgi:hypothetical protein